jgi:hypothetical protein
MLNRSINRQSFQTGGNVPSETNLEPEVVEIVQAVQAGLQSGMAPQEVVLHLAGQGYNPDEISYAFEKIGYEPSAIMTIMQAAETMHNQMAQEQMQPPGMEAQMAQEASPQSNVGNMEDQGVSKEELVNALQRASAKSLGEGMPRMAYGGYNPFYTDDVYLGENVSDGFRIFNTGAPKATYLPMLPEKGSLGYALTNAADAVSQLFSGKVGSDGLMKGAFRDLKAKRARSKELRQPSYYKYDIKLDKNDPNTYVPDLIDLYNGKIRTTGQYQKDVDKYSRLDFDTKTGKYNVLATSRELNPNLLGKKQKEPFQNFMEKSTALGTFKERFDPETKQMLLQNEKLAPKGTTIGISPSGQATSYLNPSSNPYYYETMMGLNTLKSKPYAGGTGFPSMAVSTEFPNMDAARIAASLPSGMGVSRDVNTGLEPGPKLNISPREYVNKSRSMMVPYNPATEGLFGYRNGGSYLPKAQFAFEMPPGKMSPEAYYGGYDPFAGGIASITPGVTISEPKKSDAVRTVTDPTARESFETRPYDPFGPAAEFDNPKMSGSMLATGKTATGKTNAATSPPYTQPQITKKFSPGNWFNQQLERPGVKAFAKTSGATVALANAVNEMFVQREYERYDDENRNRTMADNTFATLYGSDRGGWDVNTGLLKPEKYVPYLMSDQFTTMPGKIARYGGQQDNVYNVDMKTLTQLIAAGADIDIL